MMKKQIILVLALALTLGCEEKSNGTFTDSRDSKVYKLVKIGNQVWMAENLNYEAEDSKCYDNKPENCKKYGRLYKWDTATKACSKGWHLPNDKEWQILVDFAGGLEVAGKKLKSKEGWNGEGNGTDEYGFAALSGGRGSDRRGYSDEDEHPDGFSFNGVGSSGIWLSATETDAYGNYNRCMGDYYESATICDDGGKDCDLYSVRCIKD